MCSRELLTPGPKKHNGTNWNIRKGQKQRRTEERLFKAAWKICMRTSVDEGAVNDGLMWCDQTEQLMRMSRVTIVTTISCHVLYFQGPFPLRILVPWVCGHEGPVVESLWGEVIGPERKGDTREHWKHKRWFLILLFTPLSMLVGACVHK